MPDMVPVDGWISRLAGSAGEMEKKKGPFPYTTQVLFSALLPADMFISSSWYVSSRGKSSDVAILFLTCMYYVYQSVVCSIYPSIDLSIYLSSYLSK